MRIDSLTPEQAAMMATVRDEWIAHGLSTEPADWTAAEAAMIRAYEIAGLAPPPRIVRCSSPLALAFTDAILRDPSVGASVGDSVWDSVWASVWDSVGDSVGASVHAQWQCDWLAFYDFFGRCGLDVSRLDGLARLTQSAGWWIARSRVALIADRPRVLHRDAEGRLHCEDGPAIAWPDGWGVHAIHGVRVPAWIVEHHERITVATIDAEHNAEVKRVMLERYGMARFLADSGAELVGEDRHGRLYRRSMPGGEDIVCLVVDNSTPEPDGTIKQYVLGIHPECRPILGDDEYGDPQPLTPRNAVASTFGLRGAQYQPEIET